MKEQYAYSICDILEYIKENKNNDLIQAKYVYVGSYFCDLYFVSVSDENWKRVFDYIRENQKTAVLVIPTPSQRNLEKVKCTVEKLLSENRNVLNEVVVNDYAILRWINEKKTGLSIWCGRMVKDLNENIHIAKKCKTRTEYLQKMCMPHHYNTICYQGYNCYYPEIRYGKEK